MKKILSLLCISSSILSMQLDRMSPEAKRTLALSFITSRILVEEQPIYNTYDSSDMDDIELEHVPSHLVFAPKALGKVELLHGPEGFSVWKYKKNYAIERYFTDSLVRNMTKRELYSFSKNGYFSINQMEDGNFSLQAQTRVKGGGPIVARIVYVGTKVLCYGTISAGIGYFFTRPLPQNPTHTERAESVVNGLGMNYGVKAGILAAANDSPFVSMSYGEAYEYAAKNGMDLVSEQRFNEIKVMNETAKIAATKTSIDVSTKAGKKAAKVAAKAASNQAPGAVKRAIQRAVGTTTRNGLPRKVAEKAGTSLATRIAENTAVKVIGTGIVGTGAVAAKAGYFANIASKTSGLVTAVDGIITWAGFAPEAWAATETATVVAEGTTSGGIVAGIESLAIMASAWAATWPTP